jgi:orotidine-5'-phosphate decarboxylase
MSPELIVALDLPGSDHIAPVIQSLPPEIGIFKVGLEMFCTDAYAAVDMLHGHDKRVFLDLKLHDIPRTVARAVTAASQHGIHMLTLHASGGREMLRAAVDAARSSSHHPPKLLAVTLLTSLDEQDLRDQAVARSAEEHVLALADLALACGVDGLVCSPREVRVLRARIGALPLLVTPGVRMPQDEAGDQKRVATPHAAVADGASHLVVGRPILEASDPARAARDILSDMRR